MGETRQDKRGGGRHAPGRRERVEWLLGHRELWIDFPEDGTDVAAHWWPGRDRLLLEMKRDGVLAYTTSYVDVRLGSLIAEARRRLREQTRGEAGDDELA